MTTSFPPISYPSKPVPPFTAEPPRNQFPGFFPDMWKNITGKPYITVSSKGLANGLSEYFNNGADFGPDSLQADGSLTQTTGIQEAGNYLISNGGGKMVLKNGAYEIHTGIQWLYNSSIQIEGETKGWENTQGGLTTPPYIYPSSDFDTSTPMLSYFTPVVNSGVMKIENILFFGNGVSGVNRLQDLLKILLCRVFL